MARLMNLYMLGALLLVAAGCKKPPQLPNEPHITGYELSKTQLIAGQDTLVVQIDFEDGDGDLGFPTGQTGVNAYLIDSRTGFPFTYGVPELNTTGVPQAISGSIWFTVQPGDIQCNPLPPGRVLDTFSYEIYVRDQAGNESNRVITEDVIVQCQ